MALSKDTAWIEDKTQPRKWLTLEDYVALAAADIRPIIEDGKVARWVIREGA